MYQFVQKAKKYVHEIRVDMKENSDINKLCDELCLRESIYLNPHKISKQQVRDLLRKMQNQIIKEKKENIKNDKDIDNSNK